MTSLLIASFRMIGSSIYRVPKPTVLVCIARFPSTQLLSLS